MSQADTIEQRILKAAIALAEEGGFDAVRQRDVAARAGVALATLYARFASKDLLLASALVHETERIAHRIQVDPIRGGSPARRVTELFERLTRDGLSRPNMVRAGLRAAVSGDPDCMRVLMLSNVPLTQLIAETMRGRRGRKAPTLEDALRIANVLVMVWFASLVAWSGGAATPEMIVQLIEDTATMLLRGVEP